MEALYLFKVVYNPLKNLYLKIKNIIENSIIFILFIYSYMTFLITLSWLFDPNSVDPSIFFFKVGSILSWIVLLSLLCYTYTYSIVISQLIRRISIFLFLLIIFTPIILLLLLINTELFLDIFSHYKIIACYFIIIPILFYAYLIFFKENKKHSIFSFLVFMIIYMHITFTVGCLAFALVVIALAIDWDWLNKPFLWMDPNNNSNPPGGGLNGSGNGGGDQGPGGGPQVVSDPHPHDDSDSDSDSDSEPVHYKYSCIPNIDLNSNMANEVPIKETSVVGKDWTLDKLDKRLEKVVEVQIKLAENQEPGNVLKKLKFWHRDYFKSNSTQKKIIWKLDSDLNCMKVILKEEIMSTQLGESGQNVSDEVIREFSEENALVQEELQKNMVKTIADQHKAELWQKNRNDSLQFEKELRGLRIEQQGNKIAHLVLANHRIHLDESLAQEMARSQELRNNKLAEIEQAIATNSEYVRFIQLELDQEIMYQTTNEGSWDKKYAKLAEDQELLNRWDDAINTDIKNLKDNRLIQVRESSAKWSNADKWIKQKYFEIEQKTIAERLRFKEFKQWQEDNSKEEMRRRDNIERIQRKRAGEPLFSPWRKK